MAGVPLGGKCSFFIADRHGRWSFFAQTDHGLADRQDGLSGIRDNPKQRKKAKGVEMQTPTSEIEQPQIVRSSSIAVPAPKQAGGKNEEYT
jgi:hypothetical protein